MADCVGIRLWLSVIAITPTTTATNSSARRAKEITPSWPPSPVSFGVAFRTSDQIACGIFARMPAMMSRLIPLPMPYSSICSPIHIRKIVPAVMIRTLMIP